MAVRIRCNDDLGGGGAVFRSWDEGGGDLSELLSELKTLDEYLDASLSGDALIERVAKYFHHSQMIGLRNVRVEVLREAVCKQIKPLFVFVMYI